nr:PD40 domain-containing protein [Gemmatimonadota bacterium]
MMLQPANRRRLVFGLLLPASLLAGVEISAQARRPLTALDLYDLRTAGSVALSPDGRRAAYVQSAVDSAGNRYTRDLWIAMTDGSGNRRLTWSAATGIGSPVFSPDGRHIAFTSAREGRSQIWILPLQEGGEAWPLTDLSTGAGSPVWSPDGTRIAFTSRLSPEELVDSAARPSPATMDAAAIRAIHENREAALAAIRAKLAANAATQDPRVVTRLSYQGETSYEDERWTQIFVVDVRHGSTPRRLTSGNFSSGDPAWTPDGRSILFAAGPPAGDQHADYERESDIFVISATGGEPRRFSEPGFAASSPVMSSDGRYIAYSRRAVDTPHPTAVNMELVLMRADGTNRRSVTGTLDRGVSGWTLTRDGWLYFTVQSEGAAPLYRTRLDRLSPAPVIDGPR